MIVCGRQKLPGSREGEICQARQGLCWCASAMAEKKTAFLPDKAKINGKLYCKILLPRLVEDASRFCHLVSYSSRTEQLLTRQSWLKTEFSPTAVILPEKTNGHRTQQTLILLITMSGKLCLNATKFQPKPNTVDELKTILQTIWDDLPQNSINKAVLSFVKRFRAYVKAGVGHFEHVFKYTVFAGF